MIAGDLPRLLENKVGEQDLNATTISTIPLGHMLWTDQENAYFYCLQGLALGNMLEEVTSRSSQTTTKASVTAMHASTQVSRFSARSLCLFVLPLRHFQPRRNFYLSFAENPKEVGSLHPKEVLGIFEFTYAFSSETRVV